MQPPIGEPVSLRVYTGLSYFEFSPKTKIVAVAADCVRVTLSCGTEGHLHPADCEWLTPEGNWKQV